MMISIYSNCHIVLHVCNANITANSMSLHPQYPLTCLTEGEEAVSGVLERKWILEKQAQHKTLLQLCCCQEFTFPILIFKPLPTAKLEVAMMLTANHTPVLLSTVARTTLTPLLQDFYHHRGILQTNTM